MTPEHGHRPRNHEASTPPGRHHDEHLPSYDHRRGAGPTLVFLHYWGGSAGTWNSVVDALDGWDLLALDFRGWGRSRDLSGPYGLDQLARDAVAVIEDAGVRDYVLVGHSMGGKVSQLIAGTRPAGLRGVVLVASAPAKPPPELTADYREQLSHAYDTDDSVAAARDNVLTATTLPDSVKATIVSDSRAHADGALTEWPLRGIAEDVRDRTRRIDVPVLVIAGENDRVEPPGVLRDYLLPYLATATFTVIPATGHLVPLEAPTELAEAIATFTTTASQWD